MPTSICAYIGAFFGSSPRRLNSSARMCSTRVPTSLRIEMNEPLDEPTGESRTRMRNPSELFSM